MTDPDNTELADTLRAAIAEMEDRIEARAQQIADERVDRNDPASLLREARERVEQAGEAMRQEMIAATKAWPDEIPDREKAAELMARMPAWKWTSSAASLFFQIMEEDRKQAEGGEQRG